MLSRRARYTTEIGRIASGRYGLRRVMIYTIALLLTWVFIFTVYSLSIQVVATLAQHDVEYDFTDQGDMFAIFYGLGIVTASILTPLFGLYYLTYEIELSSADSSLAREFLRSHPTGNSKAKRKSFFSRQG